MDNRNLHEKETYQKEQELIRPQQFLVRELSLINGIVGRLANLKEIWNPRLDQIVSGITSEEISFYMKFESDRQELYRLLLASDLTPMEIPNVINNYPQNMIKFWRLKFINRLANKIYRPLNLWIGAYCWSPLSDLVNKKTKDTLQPASLHVVTNRLKGIELKENEDLVLFAGSTSGWEGNLTSRIGKNILCLYFSPSDFGGWKYALPVEQMKECNSAWFTEHMYPEDDDAINQRIRNWFKKEGQYEDRWALMDAAQKAGSPLQPMEVFFMELDHKKPKLWDYSMERKLLVSITR